MRVQLLITAACVSEVGGPPRFACPTCQREKRLPNPPSHLHLCRFPAQAPASDSCLHLQPAASEGERTDTDCHVRWNLDVPLAGSPKKEDEFVGMRSWCQTSRILDAEAAKVSPGPLYMTDMTELAACPKLQYYHACTGVPKLRAGCKRTELPWKRSNPVSPTSQP